MDMDATLEVAVYIHNFHNLDLFQQGWYAVRVKAFWDGAGETHPGTPSRVVQYAAPDSRKGEPRAVWHINDEDCSFRTQPFRIRFSRQDVALQEMLAFDLLVDVNRGPFATAVMLQFELLFAQHDKETPSDRPPENLEAVSTQYYRLMPTACFGIHRHCPLLFDTWHMALIDVNIHTVLRAEYRYPKPNEEGQRKTIGKDQSNSESPRLVCFGCASPGVRDDWEITKAGPNAKDNTKENTPPPPPQPTIDRPAINSTQLYQLLCSSKDALVQELNTYKFMFEGREGSMSSQRSPRDALSPNLSLSSRSEGTDDKEQDDRQGSWVGVSTSGATVHKATSFGPGAREGRIIGDITSAGTTPSQKVAEEISSLWKEFLYFHRLHRGRICRLLKRRWNESRAAEWSAWVTQSDVCMQPEEAVVIDTTDWASRWRSAAKASSNARQQQERPGSSASKAEQSRRNLAQIMQYKQAPLQDLQIFGNPEEQPILFVERHISSVEVIAKSGFLSPSGSLLGNILPAQSFSPSFNGNGPKIDPRPLEIPKERERRNGKQSRHVIVFVHGFQGHHLDLRLVRNNWLMLDPTVECMMSEANQDRTFDDFRDMGRRLANEVATSLTHLFGSSGRPNPNLCLGKLSFVGHSIGNVVIRAALTEAAMKPYLSQLFTFLSISGPHLGYMYSSNSIFNSGLWLLKKFKGSPCMHQLTFTDHPAMKDCYIYKLSQMKTFGYFKNVLFVASPQDRYVPYHSARIEMCPAAMKDSKKGAAYAAMLQGCLGPLVQGGTRGGDALEGTTLWRVDVNFNTSSTPRSLSTLIGRAAHIEFLETDAYVKFLLWCLKDCFA